MKSGVYRHRTEPLKKLRVTGCDVSTAVGSAKLVTVTKVSLQRALMCSGAGGQGLKADDMRAAAQRNLSRRSHLFKHAGLPSIDNTRTANIHRPSTVYLLRKANKTIVIFARVGRSALNLSS